MQSKKTPTYILIDADKETIEDNLYKAGLIRVLEIEESN